MGVPGIRVQFLVVNTLGVPTDLLFQNLFRHLKTSKKSRHEEEMWLTNTTHPLTYYQKRTIK
jgi:hypothetical protein